MSRQASSLSITASQKKNIMTRGERRRRSVPFRRLTSLVFVLAMSFGICLVMTTANDATDHDDDGGDGGDGGGDNVATDKENKEATEETVESDKNSLEEDNEDENDKMQEDEDEDEGFYYSVMPEAPEMQRCRHDPMWRADDEAHDRCLAVTDWKPRSRWWESMAYEFLGQDELFRMWECIDEEFFRAWELENVTWTGCPYNQGDSTYWENFKEPEENEDDEGEEEREYDSCRLPPMQVESMYRHFAQGDVVTVLSAFSEEQAWGLQSLAQCIRKLYPKEYPYFEERAFGDKESPDYGLYQYGGNICTFLNGFLQVFMPGVAAEIFRIATATWEAAGWEQMGYPDPRTLGIRSAEHLHYTTSGRLGVHPDTESVYTLSVALSEEDNYEGGHFHLTTRNVLFRVPRLSAMVFLSEELHGVTEILSGEREVFVLEMWPLDDVKMGTPRPSMEDWLAEIADMEQEEAEAVRAVDEGLQELEENEEHDNDEDAEEHEGINSADDGDGDEKEPRDEL